MKRFWKGLLGLFLLAAFVAPAFGASNFLPAKNHSGYLGKAGKAWYATYSDYYYMTGGTAFTVKFTGTPTANRTITFPDASGTVALSAVTENEANGLWFAANALVFEGATADAHETSLKAVDPTADNSVWLPNATGYLLYSGAPSAANALWIANNAIVFEGATADAHEVTLDVADPTADVTYRLPAAAAGTYGLVMSTLANNAPDVANSTWLGTNQIIMEGATADAYETIITPTDATADRTITIPDASGTLVLNGTASHNYAGAAEAWTMTAAEAQASYVTMTNANGAIDAVLPAAIPGKVWVVYNNSGQTVTFKVTGQTGATLATGKIGVYVGTAADVHEIYEQS